MISTINRITHFNINLTNECAIPFIVISFIIAHGHDLCNDVGVVAYHYYMYKDYKV